MTVNYTPEQTETMREAYEVDKSDACVSALAMSMGKTVRSVTAKLSRMGIFVSTKTYKTKAGTAPVRKDAHADAIGKIVPGLSESDVESLTKCTKNTLEKVFAALANSKPV